jgi:hypothetical protein
VGNTMYVGNKKRIDDLIAKYLMTFEGKRMFDEILFGGKTKRYYNICG